MALTYFKLFVWFVFPPPAVLLALLLLPLPGSVRKAVVGLTDAVLFMKPHPGLGLSLFWLALALSVATFASSMQALGERAETYNEAKHHGHGPDALVKLLAAERNAWISGCAVALWVILHRHRSLIKRANTLEARAGLREDIKKVE